MTEKIYKAVCGVLARFDNKKRRPKSIKKLDKAVLAYEDNCLDEWHADQMKRLPK